jgi:hypothetical protein
MGIYDAYKLWNSKKRKDIKDLINLGVTAKQFDITADLLGYAKVDIDDIKRIIQSETLVRQFGSVEALRHIVRGAPKSKDNEVYWCINNRIYFNDSHGLSVIVEENWVDACHHIAVFQHSIKGVAITALKNAIQDHENIVPISKVA